MATLCSECQSTDSCNYSTCICSDPFVKTGDFSINPDQPCDINLTVVIILWSIHTAAWVMFLVCSFGTIGYIMMKGRYIFRRFHVEVVMLCLKSISGILFIGVGICEIMSTPENPRFIGIDPTTTWFSALGLHYSGLTYFSFLL